MGVLEQMGEQPETAPAKSTGRPAGGLAGLMNPQAGVDYRGLAKGALDVAPLAGGILGGNLGAGAGAIFGFGVGAAPGAVGGALLGGSGGEAARQLGYRALGLPAAESSLEAAKKIGIEGAGQGLGELAGLGTVKAIGKFGLPMMRAVLKASPEAAQTALEEKIPINRGGLDRVIATLRDLGGQVRGRLADAVKRGVSFDPNKDVVQHAINEVMPGVEAGDNPSGNAKRLLQMANDWLKREPVPGSPGTYAVAEKITPMQLLKAKQAADEIAAPIHVAEGKLEIPKVDKLTENFNKAIADRIRQIFTGIPEVSDLTQRESRLINLKRTMFPVVTKDIGMLGRLARPTLTGLAAGGLGAALPGSEHQRELRGLSGLAAGAALGPEAMSNAALLSQSPELANILPLLFQVPAAAIAARAK
jgi:hypothetical protein